MYLEQLSFRHLLTLRTLHRTGSMRKTAETLGRTQPAISLQIKSLEAIVGFDIVAHERGRLAFTRQGTWLARHALQVIVDMEELVREAAAIAEAPVRVGLTEDFFRRDMKDISTLLDNQRIDVHVQCSAELVSRFLREELDIVIAKGTAPIEGAVRAWQHEAAWAGHQRHRKHGKGVDLVLLSDGCLYHRLALRTLESASRSYSLRSVCNSWTSVLRALEGGGMTVVARDWPGDAPLYQQHGDLPPLPTTTINLLLARKGSDDHREECERLAERIVEHLNLPDRQRLI